MGSITVQWRLWIFSVLTLLVLSTIIHGVAILTPKWLHFSCGNGTVDLGLWQYCCETDSPTWYEKPSKIMERDVISDRHKAKNEDKFCANIDMKTTETAKKPVWFFSLQIFNCLGLAGVGTSTLLFMCYSLTPRHLMVDVARGFVGLALSAGSCVFVALAILTGNRRKVHTLVSPECQCEETRAEMGTSVKMALVAGISMIAAACLLGSVYIAGLSKRERNNGSSGEKDTKTITKVSGGNKKLFM